MLLFDVFASNYATFWGVKRQPVVWRCKKRCRKAAGGRNEVFTCITNAAEAAGDLDLGVVEWWRPFGALVTKTSTVCVMCYNSGNPAGMRVRRERQRQFVSGHARAAVETAVDVPDHGDALSPDREETVMIIQFER